MRLYKTTHETDWRRVQWVHDEDHETRGSYAYDTEALTKAAEDHEIEGLNNGTLVVLGAIVELRCPHCRFWTDKSSLWGIVVKVGEDLEAHGTECLNIPEVPEAMDCADTGVKPPPEGPPNRLVREDDPTGGRPPRVSHRGMPPEQKQKRRLPKKVRACIEHALRRVDSSLRKGCSVSKEAQEEMRLYLDTWAAQPLKAILEWDDGDDRVFLGSWE